MTLGRPIRPARSTVRTAKPGGGRIADPRPKSIVDRPPTPPDPGRPPPVTRRPYRTAAARVELPLTLLVLAALLLVCSCAPAPRALVVLSHPDDELTLVDYLLDRGPAADLLFLTRGEYKEYTEGRAAEAEEARRVYGSRGVQLLPAPLLPLVIDPSFSWQRWDVQEKVAAVTRTIDLHRPDEVVTWIPNIAAVHGEHQLTGAITIAACLRAQAPPSRILFTYEARKVGYIRQRPETIDPEKLGMRVEHFITEYSLDSLTHLYPSMPASGWLQREADAYREGTRLVAFPCPVKQVPLSPPSADATLPEGGFRVIPHFGEWLSKVGLGPLGRIIALAPPGGEGTAAAAPSGFDFDSGSPRTMSRDGVHYILLPRNVTELTIFGNDEHGE